MKPIYSQDQFRACIRDEWRRSERSGIPKILVLIDGLSNQGAREAILELLAAAVRETDIVGWHVPESTLGILFVELGKADVQQALDAIREKIHTRVMDKLDGLRREVTFEWWTFPPGRASGSGAAAQKDVFQQLWNESTCAARILSAVKRTIDIVVSTILLTVFSPLFVMISICIRMTSTGPSYFRQTRVGFRGRLFPLYKFRTMAHDCDDREHREYVSRFISGEAGKASAHGDQPTYKMTDDRRVTPIGRWLRRTSLDELPQLWNVLRGDMSLVGPRPPLPYEVEQYQLWHRRRIYDLKPGVTGLWQVRGRSRCTFEEMTRMDLQHAKPHSLALYFRVLLETPTAVLHGNGAH